MSTDSPDRVALYAADLRLVAGAPVDGAAPYLQEAVRDGVPVRAELRDGGSVLALEVTPLPGPSGAVEHVVVVRRDVTAARAAEERAAQLRAFTTELASSLSDEEIGRTVIQPIHTALGARASVAYLASADGVMRLVAARGLPPESARAQAVLAPDSPLPLGAAIRAGEPVWVEDRAAALARFPGLATNPHASPSDLQAFAAIPARVGGRTVGGVAFSFSTPRRFDDAMREFLVAVVAQYAVAAERSRLFVIERRARGRIEALAEASRAFSAARLDLAAVLDTVCREVARRVPDSCSIALVREDATVEVVAIHHEDPLAELSGRDALASRPIRVGDGSAPGTVAATGETIFRPTVPREALLATASPEHRRHLQRYPFDGLVCVPLRARDRVIGVLTATRAGPPAFTTDDVTLLQELADRAALSIDVARVYQEAAEARERAEDASRAKDEFLALLGHELRNPLAPILASARLLRDHPGDVGARDVIERQARHLMRLVDDLLDVSRITNRKLPLRRAPVEIRAVLDRALEVARPALEQHGMRVEQSVPGAGAVVDGDADRLVQVFANLLTNAAQYGGDGGLVEITAAVSPDPDRPGEHAVVVAVRDEGIGIERELLERLFRPFTQGPSVAGGRGLGLGLAIVRSLVEMHGGEVEAHSDGVGWGSTFVVRLPASAAPVSPEPPPTAGASPAPPTPAPRRDILLVDDNRDAADALRRLLELDGHTVRVAHDAAGALVLARERLPQVALLDIGLPDVDGWELGRRLLELPGPPPTLVALTGYGQAADAERSRAAGFARHLVKPFDPDDLEAMLAELR